MLWHEVNFWGAMRTDLARRLADSREGLGAAVGSGTLAAGRITDAR
jgi:hypothetical protein